MVECRDLCRAQIPPRMDTDRHGWTQMGTDGQDGRRWTQMKADRNRLRPDRNRVNADGDV